MKKKIIVAPLNWGLGHATRCIPIINALLNQGFEPILASDGAALKLLQKEYPSLNYIELPSYSINYPKNGNHFKIKLLKDSFKILKTVIAENKLINNFIKTNQIAGIISDNRPGIYCKNLQSAYITHQLKVLSGITTWISTKIHERVIKNFDTCWIPDIEGELNLSGILGHPKVLASPTRYIGALSRFEKKGSPLHIDLLVLLSGPEPQRTLLENKLLKELKTYSGKVVFVRGVIEDRQTRQVFNNFTIYNFMTTLELEKTLNESELVISRSGYTTVMDLAKLNKKAFFIPTPGQYEQEYLAYRFLELKVAPYCLQNEFTIEKLDLVANYKGFNAYNLKVDFKELFSFF